MKIKIGDHLVSPRCGYTHHGLYIGNGNVIHYGGYAKIKSDGVILITSLEEFSQNNSVRIRAHHSREFSREESVDRALTRLGEDWYNVVLNNCEHFVTWCIDGLPNSRQVNKLILYAIGYKALTRKAGEKTLSAIPISTIMNSVVGKRTVDLASLAASASSSGLVSTGTTTGLTSFFSYLSAGAALTGAASISTPVAAAVAVGYLVNYGIRKLSN